MIARGMRSCDTGFFFKKKKKRKKEQIKTFFLRKRISHFYDLTRPFLSLLFFVTSRHFPTNELYDATIAGWEGKREICERGEEAVTKNKLKGEAFLRWRRWVENRRKGAVKHHEFPQV